MKYQHTYHSQQKKQRFAIRKLNIGLASVVFGALFYLSATEDIQAAETYNVSASSSQIGGTRTSLDSVNSQYTMQRDQNVNVTTPSQLNNHGSGVQKASAQEVMPQSETVSTTLRTTAQAGTAEMTSLQTPTVHIQQAGNQNIDGTAQPFVTVIARVNEGQMLETSATHEGKWSVAVTTPLKLNDTITVYARDSVGHQSDTMSTKVIDSISPNPPGVSHLEIGKNIIRGTGEEYRNMIVAWFPDGQMMWTKVGKNGTWMMGVPYETQIKLKVGDVVQVYEYDAANNRSEVAYVHVVEAPSLPLSTAPSKPVTIEPTPDVIPPQEAVGASENVAVEETAELVANETPEVNESVSESALDEAMPQEAESTPIIESVSLETQTVDESGTTSIVETQPEVNQPSKGDTSSQEESNVTSNIVSQTDSSEIEIVSSSLDSITGVSEVVGALSKHENNAISFLEEALLNDTSDSQSPSILDKKRYSATSNENAPSAPTNAWVNIGQSSSNSMEERTILNREVTHDEKDINGHSVMGHNVTPISNRPLVFKQELKHCRGNDKHVRQHGQPLHNRVYQLPDTGYTNISLGSGLAMVILGLPILYRTLKRRQQHH